jgi:predicted protein tyrosine phosphatase
MINTYPEMNEMIKDVFSKSEEFSNQYAHARIVELEKCNKNQSQRIDKLEKALKDFADHGTKHDDNPTLIFDETAVSRLLDYIKSMDSYVRTTAKQALNQR